jgi:UDP-N-acetylglucosamine acyltransferase
MLWGEEGAKMTDVAVLREIAPTARIAPDAEIGPFCVIGPDVRIGARCRLERRVTVLGRTTLGADNVLEEGCCLGASPQDLKYAGGATLLVVGDRNRFARFATAHIGTEVGGRLTRIGSDNVLAEGSHVAHDCFVDDGVFLGRWVLLAGHVRVETGAVLGEFAAAHHFTTIGRYARVGPRTPVRRDVPPYTDFYSDDPDVRPASVRGASEEGILAARLTPDEELDLRRAFSELFADESALQTRIEHLVNLGAEGEVAALCKFCQRSLHGVYGRHREAYRGQVPPEAEQFFAREDNPDQGVR